MEFPKVAVSQMSSTAGDVERNVRTASEAVHLASDRGAKLIVFPECALTGYMFETRPETEAAAIRGDDPRLEPLWQALAATRCFAVVGLLERANYQIFNTALVMGPEGLVGKYRKQHLPAMGADRFVNPGEGDAPRVFDLGFLRVGVMICFDLRFPESARELALDGADVIAMPTNWPPSATILANEILRARAVENFVYIAVADRADEEFGRKFYGGSRIVSPKGDIISSSTDSDAIVTAEIDVEQARTKELFFSDMGYSISIFKSRRPELYTRIAKRSTTRDPPD